jgi:dTDP-glucose 4,6-dehydratase
MKKNIIITGGAGFIGSHFTDTVLANSHTWSNVTVLDSLTYSGNLKNLKNAFKNKRFEFIEGDIRDKKLVSKIIRNFDVIVNFAAESHVDRSISDPGLFIETNVIGTQNLLDCITNYNIQSKFIQVSTDEVYGSTRKKSKSEKDILKPSSPYSASKAAADLLVRAYMQTYKINAIITRTCNNYGPRQYPEKLIPLLILNAIDDKDLPIYGNGKNVREWIYVLDNCKAIEKIIISDKFSDIVNIGSDIRLSNLRIANIIKRELSSSSRIKFIKDRKGHDFRYAISSSLLRKHLNLDENLSFKNGISQTIAWYQANTKWFD